MSYLKNSIIFSDNAVQRPLRTIRAMTVFAEKASQIASICAEAGAKDIVLAVVNADLAFGGVWRIPSRELTEHVARLPEGGWSLTFAPQTSAEQIRARCATVTTLARKRSELLHNWRAQQI